MIRKLSLLVLATALIVSACGRQVTPDRAGVGPGGLNSGFIQIKFRTLAPLDYTNVKYVIAFNTTADIGTPYAKFGNTANNYLHYSYWIVVDANAAATLLPTIQQFVTPVSGSGQTGPKYAATLPGINPSQLILNPNSNGQGTEFTITMSRALFNGLITPSPGPTGTPSPTPSPTPTGATPSPSPSGSPSPSPTSTPLYSNVWYWNFFTQASGGTVDAFSTSAFGANDTSFSYPFDVSTPFDVVQNANTPGITPASAQIIGAEFINAP